MSIVMDAATFTEISRLVRDYAGLAFGPDKRYLFESRLRPVLARFGLRSFGELPQALAHDRDGLRVAVIQALVTHETSFFRDRRVFDHLERQLLPELAEQRGGRLRIWSAATSTGQEAWTLAIVADRLRSARPGLRCEIVGSDLSEAAIARAREGRYSTFEVQRGLTARELVEYFERDGEHWRVRARLRALVRFHRHNLLDPPRPLGPPFDLVLLRNVLIYMDVPTRTRILRHVVAALVPGGGLLLGTSELLPPGIALERDPTIAGLYRGGAASRRPSDRQGREAARLPRETVPGRALSW